MKRPKIKNMAPLQSWDIFSEFLLDRIDHSRKASDIAQLQSFRDKHDWAFDPASIQNEDYKAMVITDHEQIIEWVNPGFKEMTGYAKNYAIGKHPRFLQGEKTSTTTKKEISQTLSLHKMVSKQLLNYRADGTAYVCDIKIIPLFNKEQQLTHFMALEKKARVA